MIFGRPNIEKLRAKGKISQLIKIARSHKDYNTRRLAVSALGSLRSPQAVVTLCELLKSTGSRLRIDAAEALGDIGDKAAVPPLIECLKSEAEDLQIAAADALGKIADTKALSHLTNVLNTPFPALKKSLILAIGKMGTDKAAKILNRLFWEESEEFKGEIVRAFKYIHTQSAVETLINIYQSSSIEIRETAAAVLSQSGWKPDKERADQWKKSDQAEKPIEIPPKLRQLLESKSDLPAIPEIVIKLNQLLIVPDVTLKDVGSLIKTDPSLSARTVKTANSAYFSRGDMEITDVQTAVTRLGMLQIRNLVYAFSLIKQFESAKLIDRRKFWTHSLVVAQITKALSRLIEGSEAEQETAYMAGLMHDIGIVVLMNMVPQAYDRFLRMTVGNKVGMPDFSLWKEEEAALGADHAKIGAAYIDRWWPVDNAIVQAVLHHHQNPDSQVLPLLSKTTIIANQYCQSIGLDNGINLTMHSQTFDTQKFKLLGMNEEQIEEFYQNADDEIETVKLILSFE